MIMDGTCDICRAESRPVDDYTALEEVCFASATDREDELCLLTIVLDAPVPTVMDHTD